MEAIQLIIKHLGSNIIVSGKCEALKKLHSILNKYPVLQTFYDKECEELVNPGNTMYNEGIIYVYSYWEGGESVRVANLESRET